MPRRAAPPAFECPHCGAPVKQGAAACRECGSDVDTGWQDQAEIDYQSLDLPEGYSRAPDHPSRLPRSQRPPAWAIGVAIVLIVVLVLWLVVR